jgi:DNA polymerase III delta prime subunit
MFLPHGREGRQINSIEMLQRETPIIGTGEWDSYQCRDFKQDLQINDIICVREGSLTLALCQITSPSFTDQDLEALYYNKNYRHVKVLEFYTRQDKFPQPQGTLQRSVNRKTPTWKFIHQWYLSYKKRKSMDHIHQLLTYKKQIILQGPPGTGKTYLAKAIAKQFTTPTSIDSNDVVTILGLTDKIFTVFDGLTFKITAIKENTIYFLNSENTPTTCSIENVLTAYQDKAWQQTATNGNQTAARAFAKYVYDNISSEYTTLIQLHPSYTYEDFVRGISADSDDKGNIVYETKNKVLATIADKAIKNAETARKNIHELSKEQQIETLMIQFSEKIADILEKEETYSITKAVSIVDVDEEAFRYTGNWKTSQRMKFKDLIIAQLNKVQTRQELKQLKGVSGLSKQHASYFIKVLNLFQKEYHKELTTSIENKIERPELRNYVLIIDEVNRANLASVLGELIYALEYRNEAVDSMYELDGDKRIVLPDNLYIIGTMNTADRSVGHIDYAIRRRFAFVDILPKDDVIHFPKAKALFQKVTELFVVSEDGQLKNSSFLAPDFDYKDVQLGHSYFLVDNEEALKIRLDYEIIPILNEYIKDGLLLETAKDYIHQNLVNFV